MTAAEDQFRAADLTDLQLQAAESEARRRSNERVQTARLEQRAKRNEAFREMTAKLRAENPQIAHLSDDDLEGLWSELDDFYDKWDR
jgi:hypothetical protein